jgi:hypothetical protein
MSPGAQSHDRRLVPPKYRRQRQVAGQADLFLPVAAACGWAPVQATGGASAGLGIKSGHAEAT